MSLLKKKKNFNRNHKYKAKSKGIIITNGFYVFFFRQLKGKGPNKF